MALKGRQVAVLILGVVLAGAAALYGTTQGCARTSPTGMCLKSGPTGWELGSDDRLLWFILAVIVFIVAALLAFTPWARGTDTKG